jgi:hypothetical protein
MSDPLSRLICDMFVSARLTTTTTTACGLVVVRAG